MKLANRALACDCKQTLRNSRTGYDGQSLRHHRVVRDLDLPAFDATLGAADEAACTELAERYGLTWSMARALGALHG